uniref:Uncharacterized protein n=1 Tax=Romanomermis culicivorax TaxID=13658 RepID=A0A915KST7_ROMCU
MNFQDSLNFWKQVALCTLIPKQEIASKFGKYKVVCWNQFAIGNGGIFAAAVAVIADERRFDGAESRFTSGLALFQSTPEHQPLTIRWMVTTRLSNIKSRSCSKNKSWAS